MQTVTSQSQSDFRLIILLVVAVVICMQHIPAKKDQQVQGILPISWHGATSTKEPGLYFDDTASDTSSNRYQGLPANLAPIFFLPIPVNTATPETLTIIPGIGNSLAQKIVNYRMQAGEIANASELLRIDGIGVKKAAAIVKFVSF